MCISTAVANQLQNQDESSHTRSSPAEALLHNAPRNCFSKVMRSHILRPGCMERRSYAQGPNCTAPVSRQPAVYILHAAHLHRRRNFMEGQMSSLCAADVTWVLCCTREQYEAELNEQQQHCIHPCVAETRWNPNRQPIPNGTISLAMKHKAAYIDMVDRKLPSAIVLEDDACVQPNIWEHLNSIRLPANATLYYLGSYTKNDNAFGSQWGNATKGYDRHTKLPGQHPGGLTMHERNETLWPSILGGIGYVIFAPGARVLGERPIITMADVEISSAPDLYNPSTPYCTLNANGRIVTKGAVCSNSCMARDGSGKTFKVGAPRPQFGPNRWLVWPERNLGGGTHVLHRQL